VLGWRTMATSLPGSNEQTQISTVLASRPGIMQQSLRAALTAHPMICVVVSTGDGLTALNQVVARQPALLVIDCNLLTEEIEALLAAVKAHCPTTSCLVLLNTQQRAAWAMESGADAAVARDTTPQQLQTVLAELRRDTIN
jgi:DNA-binding NarL/FixJ family response regulator